MCVCEGKVGKELSSEEKKKTEFPPIPPGTKKTNNQLGKTIEGNEMTKKQDDTMAKQTTSN